jgi:uncharacterized membrane protein
MRLLLEVGMPLLFTWGLLAAAKRRERFLQTAAAQLGVGALAAAILYPLGSVLQSLGQENSAALAGSVLYIGILVYYLLVCANIWRYALDSGLVLGLVVSFGYFMVSLIIERQIMPQA